MTFVRRAEPEDIDAIANFECVVDNSDAPPFLNDLQKWVRDVPAWLQTPEGSVASVFVVDDYGEVAAVLVLGPDGENCFFIYAVATRLDYQKQGYAERLMLGVFDVLVDHCPDRCLVWWNVNAGNLASFRLSEKLGATWHFPPGSDLMEFNLQLV